MMRRDDLARPTSRFPGTSSERHRWASSSDVREFCPDVNLARSALPYETRTKAVDRITPCRPSSRHRERHASDPLTKSPLHPRENMSTAVPTLFNSSWTSSGGMNRMETASRKSESARRYGSRSAIRSGTVERPKPDKRAFWFSSMRILA